MNVIFDTGCDWVLVYGTKCKTCVGRRFSPTKSTKITKKEQALGYDEAFMKGDIYRDSVCIFNGCAEYFDFYLVNYLKGDL